MMSLLIFLINFAGPVGSYLGIFQGKLAVDTFWDAETIRYFYPSETTEVYFYDGIVCESIIKETTYQGNIAYLRKTVYPYFSSFYFLNPFKKGQRKEKQEYYDTLFEYQNYLIWTGTFIDTFNVQESLYKTPFSLNLFWSLGLMGRTYILDLDGEGLLNDTLTLLADTNRVINIENVNTPYGLITNAYKIRTHLLIKRHGCYMNYPWRDTVRVFGFQWYKDSLWLAKESSYQVVRFWFNLGTWILIVEARIVSRTYLKDVLASISESFANKLKVIYFDKPLIFDDEVILMNNLGQILLKKNKVILDNKRYPKGIYYLKTKNNLFKLISY